MSSKQYALFASIVAGCVSPPPSGNRTVTASATTARASAQEVRPTITSSGECIQVQLVEGGKSKGAICVAEAHARGLTIIDLTDQWSPTLLQPTSDGLVPNFRAKYLELAAEKDGGIDSLAELYGIVPNLSIVQARLADDARHACHAAIDSSPITKLDRAFSQGDKDKVAAMANGRAWIGKQLQTEAEKQKIEVAALEADPKWHDKYIRWRTLDETLQGILTAQQKLACEGFIAAKDVDGSFTWRMGLAVESFQRRNFLMPTMVFDQETREAIVLDSRELDFRLALRVLRERVVEASGLIEDGTAAEGPKAILGRMVDPPAMRSARGHMSALPNSAPDLVSTATEAAARELGWTSPATVLDFLDRNAGGTKVAIKLPAVPAYYSDHMDLSVEIDRGDIYYENTPPAFKRILPRRPTLVVYVQDGATKRPLVRWPTTIGGWADQRLPSGRLVQKWKESDVGPRVYKEITAGPTWLPPKTTPDKELVKNTYPGYALKSEVFGPGPRSAYGMVLIEHLYENKLKDGTIRYDDNGIGTHGSSSVTSIVNGSSHGCHRLYNQLATRLGDFLLQHRTHVVKGEAKVVYRRNVWHSGNAFKVEIESRGFQYELTPPVKVNVTEGRILSKMKKPPRNSAPPRV